MKHSRSIRSLSVPFAAALLLSVPATVVAAEPVEPGSDFEEAEAAMKAAKYPETPLAMAPRNAGERLAFWGVGSGVLIATYRQKTNRILRLSYFLTDERPKMNRKVHLLEVEQFDPDTGRMTIRTRIRARQISGDRQGRAR